jgi:hypothetical protein
VPSVEMRCTSIRLFDSVANFRAREAFGHEPYAEVMIVCVASVSERLARKATAHIGNKRFSKRSPVFPIQASRERKIEFASLKLSGEKSSSARCHDSVGGWNCDADAPLSGTNQP